MIPKTIHQIWIGDEIIPNRCLEFIEKIKQMNPEFQHFLWRNEILEKYKDDLFLQNYIKQPNFFKWKNISNRLKLLLLRDFGGICVDVDAKPIKGFNSVLNKLESNVLFFTGVTQETKNWNLPFFTNFKILGSVKDFRLIKEGLDSYIDFNKIYYPIDISRKITDNIDQDICLFGHEYFYNNIETNKTVIIFEKKDFNYE